MQRRKAARCKEMQAIASDRRETQENAAAPARARRLRAGEHSREGILREKQQKPAKTSLNVQNVGKRGLRGLEGSENLLLTLF